MPEQPAELESLFPYPETRQFVEEFIGKASLLPNVEQIVSIDVGTENDEHQRVLVLTKGFEGIPSANEAESIWELIEKFTSEGKNIDIAPVVTESMLEEDRQDIEDLKGKEVHVLWQKPQEDNP